MTQTAHSQLPWSIDRDRKCKKDGSQGVTISSDSWFRFARVWVRLQGDHKDHLEGVANAEFIVRACNNHYELLEALKALHIEALQSDLNSGTSDGGRSAIDQAWAAIRKATGAE